MAAAQDVSGTQTVWLDGLPYVAIKRVGIDDNTMTYWFDGLPMQAVWPPAPAVTGTLNVTLDDITLAATGHVLVTGQLNVTLDDITLAATGTVSGGGGGPVPEAPFIGVGDQRYARNLARLAKRRKDDEIVLRLVQQFMETL